MQKIIVLLLSLTLAGLFGCDDGTEQQDPEVDDQAAAESAEQVVEEDEAQAEGDTDGLVVVENGAVEVQATQAGFEPSRIQAPAGEELELTFTRSIEGTCMTAVVFPELDINEELPLDEAVVISVTPEEGKELGFECPMGHGKSTIVGG